MLQFYIVKHVNSLYIKNLAVEGFPSTHLNARSEIVISTTEPAIRAAIL